MLGIYPFFPIMKVSLVLEAYCLSCSFIVIANALIFILCYSIAFIFEFLQTNLSVFRR